MWVIVLFDVSFQYVELKCFSKCLKSLTASSPSEVPLGREEAGPAHQERAYEFVECPMRAAESGKSDINPANMVQKYACMCVY